MGHYSALKKEENMTHVTIWMNAEDNILNKISQPQKDKYCMMSLRCSI